MKNVLVSWVGMTDLRAAKGDAQAGVGPLGQAVDCGRFDEFHLMSNYSAKEVNDYLKWLRAKTKCRIVSHQVKLSGPTKFDEIYEAAVSVITNVLKKHGPEATNLTFHLSPGTPAMAAVFVILSKTRFNAELIQTSKEKGLEYASVPFEFSSHIPDLLRRPDEELERLSAGLPPEAPEFDEIIRSRNSLMNGVVAKARLVAPHKVPVLIEGESGTGKELLARAIHNASPRRYAPFIAVNCGAIPEQMVESELFGHKKGAFTGATADRKGHFMEADSGTIFLDEVGELPLQTQVKLLRTLQEGEVTPLGESKPKKVDVRVIAATNRSLADESARGRFREDLYYRLAVMVLTMPPLRDRGGDLDLLIDGLIEQLYKDGAYQLGVEHKKLSAGARALFLRYNWPGNVRELRNSLLRVLIWSSGKEVSVEESKAAISTVTTKQRDQILNRPLGDGFDLQELISEVATHYLERAIKESNGVKTKAANLVGLSSYQTFSNWLDKYDVEES
jgi:transcriptional regulator with PAS, ATPase and Fis domain